MLSIREESNYLAKVIKLGKPRKHSNADRLQCWTIDYNNVITNMSYEEGDLVIYFPVLCQMNSTLLSKLNMYRHSDKNVDESIKGYIDDNGVVKAEKLRGEKSEGLILPFGEVYDTITTRFGTWSKDEVEKLVGQSFDTLEGFEICRKYKKKQNKEQGTPKENKQRVKKKEIPDYFMFHYDTNHLNINLHNFSIDDIVAITKKLHGTSTIHSLLPEKVKPTRIEKLLRWLKIIPKTTAYEHTNVWASRKVVKGLEITKNHVGYYGTEDIYTIVNDEIKHTLEPGITIYGEIVGYTPSGKPLQSDYDYGCKDGEHALYVYRITSTHINGKVREFSWQQVKDYCENYGLLHVPELYYGKLYDLLYNNANVPHLNDLQTDFNENSEAVDKEEALKELINNIYSFLCNFFLEKDCEMCTTKVPDEGFCIRKEKHNFKAYKQHSFRFKERHGKKIEKEDFVDIEEQEEESN